MTAFEPIVVNSGDQSVVVWDFADGGNHIRCLLGAKETAGRLSFFEHRLAPDQAIAAHVHEDQDEFWYFLDDGMVVSLGGQTITTRACSLVAIPAGTVHEVRNGGQEPVKSIFFTTPGGLEQFFAAVAALVASGTARPEDFARAFSESGTSVLGLGGSS